MSVSDAFVANDPPEGSNEPHGIIYTIRQKVTNDNILSYVVPTAHDLGGGDVNSYVKWGDWCATTSTEGSYIQIEFKDSYVFPTFYSFKGNYDCWYIAKEWNLYGLVSLNDEPELIATNTCIGSTYCTSIYGDGYCANDNWGTFAIHGATKAYRYFRIVSKVPAHSGSYRVNMRAFEIFGTYSKDGRGLNRPMRTVCHKSCQVARHIPLYLALLFGLCLFLVK